ncbi:GH3 family protein [Hibiscus syriacus]|uniref:GH3 family protein n=1 Tax=Hibiscus syriacus TaxID=106335 RepID=A0A6A3CYQ5_HIBSY|nr:GH3 family protein [Hibiscus syriacus]
MANGVKLGEKTNVVGVGKKTNNVVVGKKTNDVGVDEKMNVVGVNEKTMVDEKTNDIEVDKKTNDLCNPFCSPPTTPPCSNSSTRESTIKRLCSRRRSKPVIKRLGKTSSKARSDNGSSKVHQDGLVGGLNSSRPIPPAMPEAVNSSIFDNENGGFAGGRRSKSTNDGPKSILKQSPLHPNSMNDKENQKKKEREKNCSSSRTWKGKAPLRNTASFSENVGNGVDDFQSYRRRKTVLRELDADILALQDVKAEEVKAMKPLSDLAAALGMNYVFAESWAPEYGNAVLSKWPIKRWRVQNIFDYTDFRNVLKATIDVPETGEVNFHCAYLDNLDENWCMKQINVIIQSNDDPHILDGALNSWEEADYSNERWTDIVKYHEEKGKPIPKAEVMKFLKNKQYTDAKDFVGQSEPVVVIAKDQCVPGTCKYGTRVDYILASPNSPYKFAPGSYLVLSSKGTSDHHIVKVEIIKGADDFESGSYCALHFLNSLK